MQNVPLHLHRRQHPSTEIQGEHHQTVNCQTYNIVCIIHCTKLYIGETGRTLNTCFKEHLADIKHHRDKPVTNHFNQAGHSIHNIHVKGLWLLLMDNASDRKDMESYLIDKFGSRRPGGINDKL